MAQPIPDGRYEFKGREMTFYRILLEDRNIDTSGPFWFRGELYRPVSWDEAKKHLLCRILEPVTE